jgi:hypothetical protein
VKAKALPSPQELTNTEKVYPDWDFNDDSEDSSCPVDEDQTQVPTPDWEDGDVLWSSLDSQTI